MNNSDEQYFNDIGRPISGVIYLTAALINVATNIMLIYIFFRKRNHLGRIAVYKISLQMILAQFFLVAAQICPVVVLTFINNIEMAKTFGSSHVATFLLEVDSLGYYSQTYFALLVAINAGNVFFFNQKLPGFKLDSIWIPITITWIFVFCMVGIRNIFGIHKIFNVVQFFMFTIHDNESDLAYLWDFKVTPYLAYFTPCLIVAIYFSICVKVRKALKKMVFENDMNTHSSIPPTNTLRTTNIPSNQTKTKTTSIKTTTHAKTDPSQTKLLLQCILLSASAVLEPIVFTFIPYISPLFPVEYAFYVSMVLNLGILGLFTMPSWVLLFSNSEISGEFKLIRRNLCCS
uniref:G_PROTEIN_RECEP_F1_2 domain-containing protein n=1 Tax=Rhabditophanes sp. KR3021 TaxID=114890 RepID=A0AC35UEM2_9BILA